jgi:hypothetical protein
MPVPISASDFVLGSDRIHFAEQLDKDSGFPQNSPELIVKRTL